MKVDKTEQLMQMQLMTQIFKNAVGDSASFQLILESLTKAMGDGNVDLSSLGLGEQDLSDLGYGGGQQLSSGIGKNIQDSIYGEISTGNVSIDEAIDNAAKKYNIDKKLIKAVIEHESCYDPKATSWAGAKGLMQLMPDAAETFGVTDPYDIEQNVDGGTRYLRDLLNMYGNSKEMALAAYSAGSGTLRRRGVTSTDGISKLPYETREFVNKIMQYYGK